MGWLCYDINTSPKVEMDRVYNWDSKDENGNLTKKVSVLRSCMKGSHYYAAVKVEDLVNKTEQVIAACCLTFYSPKARQRENFGYKGMDETYGPCMYDCPETILKLLTPTENKCALEWRKTCWGNINKRKKLNKLPLGTKIKFTLYERERTARKEKIGWIGWPYKYPVCQIPVDFEILN